jgi:calcineurin-like phosphoesterase family protein
MEIRLKNTKTYIASDFHFNHNRPWIYEARGFKNIEDHDEWLLRSLNKIPQDATLFFLGDFSLNSTDEKTIELLRKIKVDTIFYLFGNHESCMSRIWQERKEPSHVRFLGHYAEITHTQHGKFVLSHFPFAIWHKYNDGVGHIHGHCHGNFEESGPDYLVGKRLDCGVDTAMKVWGEGFFELGQIKKILDTKEINILDHHGKYQNTCHKPKKLCNISYEPIAHR